MFAALVLFLGISLPAAASMALTETIATIPEGTIDLELRGEAFTHGDGFRRETVKMNFGILSFLSLGYWLQFLQSGLLHGGEGDIGDSFLRAWLYLGDYGGNTLHIGLLSLFRIPTGASPSSNPKWTNLVLGKNELKLGPVVQYDAARFYFHVNLFYVFLEPESLDNDYAVFSLAVNTDLLYPFIPYAEFYTSSWINKPNNDPESLYAEGSEVNPLILSAGCRYFLSASAYVGAYFKVAPIRREGYIEEVIGLDVGVQF